MKRIGLVLVAAACSTASADKESDAAKLAGDELAQQVAQAKLAGTWKIGPLYWDSSVKHTATEARLVFDSDTDALASPAFEAADRIELDMGPPARIVVHADVKKLHDTADQAASATAALALARPKLKELPRYAYWKKQNWKYETRVLFSKGHAFVSFDTPGVTDQDVSVEIDVAAKKVIAVRLGEA